MVIALLMPIVGNEFEEDQREDDVLVFRGLNAASQLVGGVPEGFLKGFRGFLAIFCLDMLRGVAPREDSNRRAMRLAHR